MRDEWVCVSVQYVPTKSLLQKGKNRERKRLSLSVAAFLIGPTPMVTTLQQSRAEQIRTRQEEKSRRGAKKSSGDVGALWREYQWLQCRQ
jgi:hypothetical protein